MNIRVFACVFVCVCVCVCVCVIAVPQLPVPAVSPGEHAPLLTQPKEGQSWQR